MSISQLIATLPVVDKNGQMVQAFRTWVQQVTDLSILSGAGSPEGAVVAQPTRLYMDTTGSTGSILWIKQTGSDNTGWVLV